MLSALLNKTFPSFHNTTIDRNMFSELLNKNIKIHCPFDLIFIDKLFISVDLCSFQPSKVFVDFRKIRVVGGKGGDGFVSFCSMPGNEWAGPDGGNGGNGGHIIFKGTVQPA